jgi:hypothetical protein
MAFVLVFIGLTLAYLDYLGTGNLVGVGSLLKQETLTNTDPFYKWAGALIIVGLIGYVPEMRGVAIAMLILIVLALLLSNTAAVGKVAQAL